MDGSSCHLTLCILFMVHFFTIRLAESFTVCPPQSVKCNNTMVCIDSRYICDGDDDCGNGEDELNCGFINSGCGGVSNQTGMNGTITSMGYPQHYSNMADCRWHIQVPDLYVLVFDFVGIFDLEKAHHGQCVYDVVSIYQDEPLILQGEYCGSVIPGSLVVNSSKAVVEFHSDGRTNGVGFELRWTAQEVNLNPIETEANATSQPAAWTSQPVCGDVIEVSNGFGDISSPLYSDMQPYPASFLCRWRIKVLPAYSIVIDFEFLDVGDATPEGCKNDWLEIYDGHDESSALIGQFCGAEVPAEQHSMSNEVFIAMSTSNNDNNHMGFRLSYTAFRSETTSTSTPPPGCNGDPIDLKSSYGYITSPNFNKLESYRDQLDCEWILQGTPGNVFYFTFHDFEMEQSGGCIYDSLSVYDSIANSSISFNVSSEISQTLDSGNITSSEIIQTFDSGNITSSEINHTLDSGHISTNFVLVEIAQLCGVMLPFDIESSSSRVVLSFKTDAQVGGIGFNLSYTLQPPTVKCLEDEFKCDDSACIKDTLVCDGVDDCTGGSDEVICANTSSCGRPAIQPVFSRIVGGSEAVEGSWPWTVSIAYSSPAPYTHTCGATLILPQWVLTATHCFDSIFSRKYDGFHVIAGRHQVNHPDKNEQIREFDKVFLHHDYETVTTLNDIALIKIKEPFNLTNQVNLACLPEQPAPEGKLCYITGWGETMNTCCAGRMKQAAVPIMNSTLCGQPDFYDDRFREHMMCAGYPDGGVDSCDGDSGGPLVCESQSPDRHWEIQGVISWGVLCASPKRPGVYTTVHDYIKWIQQTIALNSH